MPFKKPFFLILIFLICNLCNYAQHVNYSNLFPYEAPYYVCKVAGKVGNYIHIWKFNEMAAAAKEEKSPISILIFSDQMKLIHEIAIKMMDGAFLGGDEYFQMEGDVYYAYINYVAKDFSIKKQALKIDVNGKVIYAADDIKAPEKHRAYYASEEFPYIKKDSNEYYTTTNSTMRQLNEGLAPVQNQTGFINTISIHKEDLTHRNPLMQTQYSSAIFNFTDTHLALDSDNTVWVCASNKFDPDKKRKDPSMLYSLFLVRLDSNLREVSTNEKFLKINAPDIHAHTFYKLDHAFVINKKLYLLAIGNHLTTYYSDYSAPYQRITGQRYLPLRVGREGYEIKSLRILQIDEFNNCLLDTIISTDLFKAKLLTGRFFYSPNADGIDLFYLQQFPHKTNGILHISVSRDGIGVNDVPVNPNYHYLLQNSTKIDESTYIIPFSDQKNIGFVKWSRYN